MSYRFLAFLVIAFIFVVISCSRPPYYQSNKIYKKQAKLYAKTLKQQPVDLVTAEGVPPYWVGTTNFNMRKPNYVIIHHTAQNSCDQTLKTFTLSKSQVSAHYVICKDGTVHHMLNDYLRAWHAGIGKWGNLTDVNSSSIGIEIDNNGFEAFTDRQVTSLLQLLDSLKRKYAIPVANFIGHADIAPTRKVDPNVHFPWNALAVRGFGLWFGDTTNVVVPVDFSTTNALRIIGYDVKDSTSAIKAFKRHFLQDTSAVITDADKKVMYDLMNKSM
jgi:N-acetylmuramoyl-L-alanine amidase